MQPANSKQAARYPDTDELRIYFGDSPEVWKETMIRNGYGPAVMLPPGDDFMEYRWPVKDREVLMVQVGTYPEKSIPPFCHRLVMQGAPIVRVLYGSQFAVFRTEASHALAA